MSQPQEVMAVQPTPAEKKNENAEKAKAFAEKHGLADKLKKFVKKKLGIAAH